MQRQQWCHIQPQTTQVGIESYSAGFFGINGVSSLKDIPEMITELPVNNMMIRRKVVVGSDRRKERLKVGKKRGQRRRCSNCHFPGVHVSRGVGGDITGSQSCYDVI